MREYWIFEYYLFYFNLAQHRYDTSYTSRTSKCVNCSGTSRCLNDDFRAFPRNRTSAIILKNLVWKNPHVSFSRYSASCAAISTWFIFDLIYYIIRCWQFACINEIANTLSHIFSYQLLIAQWNSLFFFFFYYDSNVLR